jgi:hypothetical protein
MNTLAVIPKIFQKSDGGLLHECIMCNQNLHSPAQDYLIEKSLRVYPDLKKTEVIFEYAMCLRCAQAMHNELSTESKQRIEAYFAKHVNPEHRQNLLSPKRLPVRQWISHCLVKQTPIKKSLEYSVYAHAYGKKLVYDFFPYAISGAVMEEVNELLSAHSRQILDDFIGKHFTGPPEIAELLKRRPVLV